LLDLLAFQPQRKGHAAAMKALNARGRINAERQDFFGRMGGNFFNIHAAFGRNHKADARADAIHQQRQIQFARDVGTIFDIDPVHLLSGRPGLMGHKCPAQHGFGMLFRLCHRFRKAHTALFASRGFLEAALAAPARMDLRFHHPKRAIKLASRTFGLFRLENDPAIRNGHAIGAQ
jgi:hypothetical protein